MTQRIELFLLSMTQRFGPFFKYDGKNWTLFQICLQEMNFFFQKNDSQNWNLFEYASKNETFFLYDSKNGTILFSDSKNWILIMTLRTQLFFSNVTQFFFWTLLEELNPYLLCLQNLNPFFFEDSTNWTLL